MVATAVAAACERNGMRICEFSMQSNHIHLLVEADGNEGLSRGMQGLLVRLARRLNRHWQRRGTVFPDRYHAVAITCPKQARNTLAYVLNNARKHGHEHAPEGWVDPFSSAPWFDAYSDRAPEREFGRPTAEPHFWLLRDGWANAGGSFPTDYLPSRRATRARRKRAKRRAGTGRRRKR